MSGRGSNNEDPPLDDLRRSFVMNDPLRRCCRSGGSPDCKMYTSRTKRPGRTIADPCLPRMTSVTSDSILYTFRRAGALLDGHFRLSSGLHSPSYLQCALVLQHPREAEALGAAIAARVGATSADVVLSPALGGIVI